MATRAYSERVMQLLTIGDPRPDRGEGDDGVDFNIDDEGEDEVGHEHGPDCGCGEGLGGGSETWADYAAMGITPDDAAELIEIATDKRLLGNGDEQDAAGFAPIHAWRALGQLGCEAAIKPLADVLDYLVKVDHDWGLEELPEVFAAIGPASIGELKRVLPDQRRDMWARVAASTSLRAVAEDHPAHRDEVVRALRDQLGLARFNDPDFNEMIVADLIELRAVESEGEIRSVYESGLVGEEMCGGLDDVLKELHRPVSED